MKRRLYVAAVTVGLILISAGANAKQGKAQPQAPSPVGNTPHEPAPGLTMTKATITARGAQIMIDAITSFATSKSAAVSVAIVDDGGNLLAFKRMDGASLGTIQAVLTKSVSALRLQASTEVLMQLAQHDVGLVLGFSSAGFTILGGGQPIRVGNAVVGGIAVSGGAGGDDDDYIKVGLDAFKP